MNYETIADIYSANQKIRDRFQSVVKGISDAEATVLPEGEPWSIQQIVEHVLMVEFGTSRICAKLLDGAKAAGKTSDGSFTLSANFGERAAEIALLKVEAPERVQPTGNVTIAESLERLVSSGETIDSMRIELARFDLSGHKFPHPFFGDLTAGEWLVMVGLHEERHTRQIEKIIEKIRQ